MKYYFSLIVLYCANPLTSEAQYKDISVPCPQPTALESRSREMKLVSFRKQERQIIRIIRHNSDLRRSHNGDSIAKQVMRLGFVEDVLWDGCYEKIAIYPTFYNLGVIMNIHGKRVERCYHIKGSKLRYACLRIGGWFSVRKLVIRDDLSLDYETAAFCPGFIKEARDYCNRKADADRAN